MSTRPEIGSPDELAWLRGFEEARNHFLAENARLREALERIYNGEPDPDGWWASIAKDALEGK